MNRLTKAATGQIHSTTRWPMGTTRYVVQWVSGDSGAAEPTPDDYVYESLECCSLAEADEVGHRESRAAGICFPWWRVSEERYDPNYYEPGIGGWEEVRRWVEGIEVRI